MVQAEKKGKGSGKHAPGEQLSILFSAMFQLTYLKKQSTVQKR